jgi:prevent-host-death family protein
MHVIPTVQALRHDNCSIAALTEAPKIAILGGMKTIAATEAKNRFGAVLDDAQREPVVIRKQDRDVAVVLSMAEFERMRTGNLSAFLELRNEVAAAAVSRGLTEQRLAELLTDDVT